MVKVIKAETVDKADGTRYRIALEVSHRSIITAGGDWDRIGDSARDAFKAAAKALDE